MEQTESTILRMMNTMTGGEAEDGSILVQEKQEKESLYGKLGLE